MDGTQVQCFHVARIDDIHKELQQWHNENVTHKNKNTNSDRAQANDDRLDVPLDVRHKVCQRCRRKVP